MLFSIFDWQMGQTLNRPKSHVFNRSETYHDSSGNDSQTGVVIKDIFVIHNGSCNVDMVSTLLNIPHNCDQNLCASFSENTVENGGEDPKERTPEPANVPVKNKADTFFANERTFLNWLLMGLGLLALSGYFYAVDSGDAALYTAIAFVALSLIAVAYSVCLFYVSGIVQHST